MESSLTLRVSKNRHPAAAMRNSFVNRSKEEAYVRQAFQPDKPGHCCCWNTYLESPDHSWKWSIMLVIALVAMVMGHQGGGPSARQFSGQSPRLLSATIATESARACGLGRGVAVGLGTGAASAFSDETDAGLPS